MKLKCNLEPNTELLSPLNSFTRLHQVKAKKRQTNGSENDHHHDDFKRIDRTYDQKVN